MAAAGENRNSNFVGFLKIKNSLASFSLIFENSSPKGFSWQNMKKFVISVLKKNSQYLQSHRLNPTSQPLPISSHNQRLTRTSNTGETTTKVPPHCRKCHPPFMDTKDPTVHRLNVIFVPTMSAQ